MAAYGTNRTEVVIFTANVPAGQSVKLRERIKSAGTVESVRVNFYKGQQLALQVNPYVLHKRNRMEPLVTYAEGTQRFLSGDDDKFEFPSVVTVDIDDELIVEATNTDATYAYTLVCHIVVDYFGGKDRVV